MKYTVQLWVGDYPLSDQKYWTTEFDSVDDAKSAGEEMAASHPRKDEPSFHIYVSTTDSENMDAVAIKHQGRWLYGSDAQAFSDSQYESVDSLVSKVLEGRNPQRLLSEQSATELKSIIDRFDELDMVETFYSDGAIRIEYIGDSEEAFKLKVVLNDMGYPTRLEASDLGSGRMFITVDEEIGDQYINTEFGMGR